MYDIDLCSKNCKHCMFQYVCTGSIYFSLEHKEDEDNENE